jgi:hypothetical protein
MATHDLKIWPEYFDLVQSGEKTFEVRFNDRNFRKGDELHLHEWDPSEDKFTGRSIKFSITYVQLGLGPGQVEPLRGLVKGFCVLGLKAAA